MLPLLVLAQFATAANPSYSSERVRDLVARATVANHSPPPELRGYRARVETEFSISLRDTLGRERAAQIEQLSSKVAWTRDGKYDMHVVGYRSQSLGAPISTLSFVNGWTEPTLYGDRLQLGVRLGAAADPKAKNKNRGSWIVAVHPFSYDRDRYYKFSGGDTVVVMQTASRTIRLVRVHVTPRLGDATRLAAFEGEIDLDADRHQIVRMRGQFVVLSEKGRPTLSPIPGLVGVVYCEFVNAEIDGRFWLPAFQRTTPIHIDCSARPGRDAPYRPSPTHHPPSILSPRPTRVRDDTRTTLAPSDSVSLFGGWDAALAPQPRCKRQDFEDVAPDIWKQTGPPRVDIAPTKTDNIFRYNRVEGLYTGLELNLRMRSAAPGLSFGGSAGWAWTERTLRGGAHIALRRYPWRTGIRAERQLQHERLHTAAQSGERWFAAMFGSVDDFDYVDRRIALASVTRVIGVSDAALVTLQAGAGSDRVEVSRLEHGLAGGGTFKPNRGSAEGNYSLGVFEFEFHPGVSGDFVQPGVGAKLHYEIGRGGLEWQRAEVLVAGRRYLGPVALSLQGDAGAVWGDVIPPQKLFEVGGSGTLTGYDYKEFAGDRAALLRGQIDYAFPLWRMPHRLWSTLFIPGVAPGIAVGLQGGWTSLTNDAARAAVDALGPIGSTTPVSRPTDGFRATVGFGLTFFSGTVHVGVARPVDHQAPWKFVWGLGHNF